MVPALCATLAAVFEVLCYHMLSHLSSIIKSHHIALFAICVDSGASTSGAAMKLTDEGLLTVGAAQKL
jgi:hypothetical protein